MMLHGGHVVGHLDQRIFGLLVGDGLQVVVVLGGSGGSCRWFGSFGGGSFLELGSFGWGCKLNMTI